MIVGQLFLPASFSYSEKRTIQPLPELISPKLATATTPYLLYEAPITSLWFVGFMVKPGPVQAEFGATIIDLSPELDLADLEGKGMALPGKLWMNAPLMFEKLIENAAQELQPLLEHKAPFEEMANVWANHPEVYKTFIDQRKNPGAINRQNSYIILAWEGWEIGKVPLKERVAIMNAEGFGDLTPTNLQKRAERLGLLANRDDKLGEFVVTELLEPIKLSIM